jgi:hypothetical protein
MVIMLFYVVTLLISRYKVDTREKRDTIRCRNETQKLPAWKVCIFSGNSDEITLVIMLRSSLSSSSFGLAE